MKKILIILSLIILTGCNLKNNNEKIDTKLKNENIQQTINNSLNAENVTINMITNNYPKKIKIEASDKYTKFKIEGLESGINNEKSEIYMEKEDETNKITTYIKITEWVKKTTDDEGNKQITYNFINLLTNQNITKQNSDIENKNKYEALINKNEIEDKIGEFTDTKEETIKIKIYTDGTYISKIIIPVQYENIKTDIVIKYEKYNETQVIIPDEALQAKSYDDMMKETLDRITKKLEEEENRH